VASATQTKKLEAAHHKLQKKRLNIFGRTESEMKKSERRHHWNWKMELKHYHQRKKTEMVRAHLVNRRWQTADTWNGFGDESHFVKLWTGIRTDSCFTGVVCNGVETPAHLLQKLV